MESHLFIGGAHDGLNMPVVDGLDAVRLPVSVTDRETYIRSTVTVGDASVAIYKGFVARILNLCFEPFAIQQS